MAKNSTSGTAKKVTSSNKSKPQIVEPVQDKKVISPKDIDASQYVTVRNGFQGRLIYESRKTGEVFTWDEFGAEQEMELRELLNAKNSCKQFFIDNWFMFDEDWIIDYLGVRQYYKNAIPVDNFDDVFSLKPAELKKKIASLSNGQKNSLTYRAKELVSENKIDSVSVIRVLEESLGVELMERLSD